MNKMLCIVICLNMALHAFGQKIIYSNNRLPFKIDYGYYIIGKVDSNILVWQIDASNYYKTNVMFGESGYSAVKTTDARKHYNSNILIYNNDMQLINTVNTKMLECFVGIQPYFFTEQNCFKMVYSCQQGDTLSNKVASFDANGNLKNIETLYSRKIEKEDMLKPDYSFSILQSNNKKNTCFIKTTYNERNYNLEFNYSFIDDTITNKTFSFSIDINKKMFASMNIDNDKNLLLVFEEKKGDSSVIEIMRKNFSDELMLVTDKTLKIDSIKDHSIHIAQNAAGYILFIELNNGGDKNLLAWQTNNKLDDIACSTILNRRFNGLYSFIPFENNKQNVFIAWNDYKDYVQPQSSSYFYYKRNSYTNAFSNNSTEYFIQSPVKNIELFGVDSLNTVTWWKAIDDNSNGKAGAGIGNINIVESNENLHLLYETRINNKPMGLNHFVITSEGSATERNFITWNMKYEYLLDKGKQIDDNTLIVPAVKGDNMGFAKITLD